MTSLYINLVYIEIKPNYQTATESKSIQLFFVNISKVIYICQICKPCWVEVRYIYRSERIKALQDDLIASLILLFNFCQKNKKKRKKEMKIQKVVLYI